MEKKEKTTTMRCFDEDSTLRTAAIACNMYSVHKIYSWPSDKISL